MLCPVVLAMFRGMVFIWEWVVRIPGVSGIVGLSEVSTAVVGQPRVGGEF